jgi:hypothetical protein
MAKKDKIVEFPEQGVKVTIPKQRVYTNVYVEDKKLKPKEEYPSKPGFDRIKMVINIAFFVIDEETKKKKYVKDLNPKAVIRVYFDEDVKNKAQGKQKKLAWWDGSDWVDLGSINTSTRSKKWEGYGEIETPGWDDPPIAWGT